MTGIALLLSLLAQAPPAGDMERARQAYESGLAAYQLGKFDEASQKFEESYRIAKLPVVLFNMAQCHRRLFEQKHDVENARKAVELYHTFLREAAPNAGNRAVAEKMTPELEQAIEAERRRRREELVAKANGRDALFVVDALTSDGALSDAALVLDRLLGARGNPRDVLVGALQKRAVLAGRLGQAEVAREAFTRALVLDPGYLLPEGADAATTTAFADARKRLEGKSPLGFVHVPPGEVLRGKPARVAITSVSDPLSQIERFAVYYRVAGHGAYSSVLAQRSADAIEIPTAFLAGLRAGVRVDYYVVALDAREDELALAGSSQQPFVFTIAGPVEVVVPTPSRPPAWYRRWWVWALVGGAAAAGGTAVVLATRSDDLPTAHFPSH